MKNIGFIVSAIVLFIAASFGGWYVFRDYNFQNKSDENAKVTVDPTPQEFPYTVTKYFVPITGQKNPKLDLTTAEIPKLTTVYALNSEIADLKNISELANLNFEGFSSNEQLTAQLVESKSEIGFVSVDNLSFKLKSLSYNGQFIFEKEQSLENYGLKTVTALKSSTEMPSTANYSHKDLIKIGHTGSMIPARGVHYQLRQKWNSDFRRLFTSTKPLFDKFDYLSSTFEAPVNGKGNVDQCEHCFTFVGPDTFMDAVQYSGIDFFSMAANHVMDGGVAGMANTQKRLNELGIKYTGGSTINNDDAGKPVLVDIKGMKIAYLAFNDTPGVGEWAGENKPGAAVISDYVNGQPQPNEARIKYFLQRAKDLNPDYVFVSMHWGWKEYDNKALPYTKTLKNLLIENGADVILGDHPHWVAEIEYAEDKPVFYSVGNFIFDQMWSIETREGMSIELNYVNKKLVNYRLHPHLLDLYDNGTVQLLTPDKKEYQDTLNRVWEASKLE